MFEFTRDYFTENIPNFQRAAERLGIVERVLEIGSYQGRSACWMLENMISSSGELVCIDPFLHQDPDPFCCDYPYAGNPEITARFWRNIRQAQKPQQRVELLVSRSYPALAELISRKQQFDFVYIDGNHRSPQVLTDAVMCWGLLKSTGIMLFDDYLKIETPGLQGAQPAIDSFLEIFQEHVEIVCTGWQVAVKKI